MIAPADGGLAVAVPRPPAGAIGYIPGSFRLGHRVAPVSLLQSLDAVLRSIDLVQHHRIGAMRVAAGGPLPAGAGETAHRRIGRALDLLEPVGAAPTGAESARRIAEIRRRWKVLAVTCGRGDVHRGWAQHDFLLADLHRHARALALELEPVFHRESPSGRLLDRCVFSIGHLTGHLQALCAAVIAIRPGRRCEPDVMLRALDLLTEAEVDLQRLALESRAIRSFGPAFAVPAGDIAIVLRELREQFVGATSDAALRSGVLERLEACVDEVRELVFESLDVLAERAG